MRETAFYPATSRLEPSGVLGQKGALPVPGKWFVAARLPPANSGKPQRPFASSAAEEPDGAVAERLKAAVC